MLPIGRGTLLDLSAVLADHWAVGPAGLASLNSGPIAIAKFAGVLLAGPSLDRFDRVRAFSGACLVIAGLVAALALAPKAPALFVGGMLAYALLCSFAEVAGVTRALQLMGDRDGATKLGAYDALVNVPVVATTALDGWLATRFGTDAILFAEAGLTVVSLGLFAIVFPQAFRRPRRATARARSR